MNKSKYPVRPSLLEKIAKLMFAPVIHGESALVVWFPGTGENLRLQQILNEKQLVKKVLKDTYKRYILIPLDVHEFNQSGIEEWPQLIWKRLFPKEKESEYSFEILKRKLVSLVEMGKEVVFITYVLNYLPQTLSLDLLRFLQTLVNQDRNRLHLLTFISDRNLQEKLEKGHLSEFTTVLQNRVIIPIPDADDVNYFINFFDTRWKLNLQPQQLKKIKELGGIYLLTKQALREIRQDKSNTNFIKGLEMKLRVKMVRSQLSQIDWQVLEKISRGENPNAPFELDSLVFFQEAGVIRKKGYRYEIYVPILEYLANSLDLQKLRHLKWENNRIKIDNLDLQQILSEGEYKVLEILFKNLGEICNKDSLAYAIWGKDIDKHGTDWALEKHISRLREKLVKHAVVPSTIQTVRKQGYRLIGGPKI